MNIWCKHWMNAMRWETQSVKWKKKKVIIVLEIVIIQRKNKKKNIKINIDNNKWIR